MTRISAVRIRFSDCHADEIYLHPPPLLLPLPPPSLLLTRNRLTMGKRSIRLSVAPGCSASVLLLGVGTPLAGCEPWLAGCVG